MVCKPPDTTGETANRFENDLVRPPQADCCAVSISLIIPHVDRGGLSVSVIDRVSRSHMWVRYVPSGPPSMLLQLSPTAEEIHGQPLHFEPVYPQRRSARASCSPIPFSLPSGIQDERTGGSDDMTQPQKRTLILFIGRGQTAGVFGFSWKCTHLLLLLLLLLFLLIFHQGHLLADTI